MSCYGDMDPEGFVSLMDTGGVPFTTNRRGDNYPERPVGYGLDTRSVRTHSNVRFGSVPPDVGLGSSITKHRRETIYRNRQYSSCRLATTTNMLSPVTEYVTRDERKSLRGRPAFMPRGDVKRRPCSEVYGDYDPIRHQWDVKAEKMQTKNAETLVQRKKAVPLPEAVGDYDPIYQVNWIQKPRGEQHVDREYRPEHRTKKRLPSPPVADGKMNVLTGEALRSRPATVERNHTLRPRPPTVERKAMVRSYNHHTHMDSTFVPEDEHEERRKLPPLASNKCQMTIPRYHPSDSIVNMSVTKPRFYLPPPRTACAVL